MSSLPATTFDQVLALPVTGEAFYLRRRGYSVLVDSGWRKDKVANVLAKHLPSKATLDIVVCTHGDGDHAGGLPDLLRRWPGCIGQVWLPGRWVEVVPQLLKDPMGFVNDLIRELDSIIGESGHDPVVRLPFDRSEGSTAPTSPESSGIEREVPAARAAEGAGPSDDALTTDEDRDDPEIDLGATEPTDDPPWFADLRAAKDLATEEEAVAAFRSATSRIAYRRGKGRLAAAVATAWLGMVDTVRAIRGIAAAAIARRLRIRWFDYHAFARTLRPSGGVRGFLEPINAREQAPAPFALSFLMKLTEINRQSLVFLAPPTWRRIGVLFCGDSPLGDGGGFGNSFLTHTASPRFPLVATAPHHGAETNRAAYSYMRGWADVWVLLRAGGGLNHPGPTFKGLNWPLKVCATCPASGRAPSIGGVASLGPDPFPRWFILGMPCGCA